MTKTYEIMLYVSQQETLTFKASLPLETIKRRALKKATAMKCKVFYRLEDADMWERLI
jgi:hypothetical protein